MRISDWSSDVCSSDLLASTTREESIDEMKHAEKVVERILYLDGTQNLQRLSPLRVGETPHEQLRLDLELEREAIPRLNNGIATATAAGDNGTRELLEAILVDAAEHADWLESPAERREGKEGDRKG